MASTKPTIVLLHGCFGTSVGFARLVPHLEAAGYPIAKATFPSVNPEDPAEASTQTDIEFIVPSYGGVVGGAAATGLSKTDRAAQGLTGGVTGVVYIAGNITKENQSLLESCGDQWPPWFIKDTPRPGLAIMMPIMDTMYNDVDASLEPELTAAMVPHGYNCLVSKPSAPCWAEKGYVGRLGYIRTLLDRVNPLFAQDMSMKDSGPGWDVIDMNSCHAAFVSLPEELARNIVTLTTRFDKVQG